MPVPPITDRLRRPLRDLRISVTDRCNFRCRYCMPREVFGPGFAFLERDELLSFEELTRIATAAAGLGVRKIRLTGGEPLLRRGLPELVGMLSAVPGIEDLALTTNGALLQRQVGALAEAGLGRVTVSIDSLRDDRFRAISDVDLPLATVLDGIDAAVAAGLSPIKLNVVVKRGVNDDELVELAAFGRTHGHTVRFIEYMDVGVTNDWRLDDVVPADEILATIGAAWPVDPVVEVADRDGSAPAERYRYRDGAGELGIIASVTRPFCGACTRARLSAVGELFTCLFAARGTDLRAVLRGGATDDDIADALAGTWARRTDRYSELRGTGEAPRDRVEMSYIGG